VLEVEELHENLFAFTPTDAEVLKWLIKSRVHGDRPLQEDLYRCTVVAYTPGDTT